MIAEVPATSPVTTPVEDPIITLELLLVHVPPAGVEFNVVVDPIHTFSVPVIAVGSGLTVAIAVIIHPVPSV